MDIFTNQFTPPLELKTNQFHLFPTNADLFASDYEAVMKSRTFLRLWSQSSWPEDSFTLEQNRDDLLLHTAENLSHAAYGFMVYSLDHTRCLGSLYVNPLANVRANYSLNNQEREIIADSDARIDYWLREDSSDEFEFETASEICRWIADEWKIKALLSAREGMQNRIKIYERLGLKKVASPMARDPGISLVLYR